MDLDIYLKKIKFEEKTGLSKEDIIDIEREIGFVYPIEYKEMLMKFNGGYGSIGRYYIDFWEIDDILVYYDENEDIKDLIIFASDGCGVAFAFKKKNQSICSIPMDSLKKAYSREISANYVEFLQKMYDGKLKY